MAATARLPGPYPSARPRLTRGRQPTAGDFRMPVRLAAQLFMVVSVCGLLLVAAAQGAVRPHALFADGAVLQQGIKVPVWGTAKDGEKVTVSFQGQEVSTMAKDGRWRADLTPLKPGGPFEMTIAGENTIKLGN